MLRATDVDCLITRDDHIARLPVHDSTPQGRPSLMHLARRTSAPTPRRLVHQHAVRSRDEEIHGRDLVSGLTKAESRDGLRGGFVHGAGLGNGGERSGA